MTSAVLALTIGFCLGYLLYRALGNWSLSKFLGRH